jgi:hypothetical protein
MCRLVLNWCWPACRSYRRYGARARAHQSEIYLPERYGARARAHQSGIYLPDRTVLRAHIHQSGIYIRDIIA